LITYEDNKDETIKLILHKKNGNTQSWHLPKLVIDLTKIEKHIKTKCEFCIERKDRSEAMIARMQKLT